MREALFSIIGNRLLDSHFLDLYAGTGAVGVEEQQEVVVGDRLPALVARGFEGPIYTTSATADLLDIMLRDSAQIQEKERAWRDKHPSRASGAPEAAGT